MAPKLLVLKQGKPNLFFHRFLGKSRKSLSAIEEHGKDHGKDHDDSMVEYSATTDLLSCEAVKRKRFAPKNFFSKKFSFKRKNVKRLELRANFSSSDLSSVARGDSTTDTTSLSNLTNDEVLSHLTRNESSASGLTMPETMTKNAAIHITMESFEVDKSELPQFLNELESSGIIPQQAAEGNIITKPHVESVSTPFPPDSLTGILENLKVDLESLSRAEMTPAESSNDQLVSELQERLLETTRKMVMGSNIIPSNERCSDVLEETTMEAGREIVLAPNIMSSNEQLSLLQERIVETSQEIVSGVRITPPKNPASEMASCQEIALGPNVMSSNNQLNELQERIMETSREIVLGKRVVTPRALPTADFRVFLLLIHPQSKTFEIVQLMYSPVETTIGHLIQMIPNHATNPTLRMQKYVGFCRPNEKEEEFLDLDVTVSAGVSDKIHPNANIQCNELLVAIPYMYSSKEMVRFTRHILANPSVRKLLQQMDPSNKAKSPTQKKTIGSHGVEDMVNEDVEVRSEGFQSCEGSVANEIVPAAVDQQSEEMSKVLLRAAEAAARANNAIDDATNDSFHSAANRISVTAEATTSPFASVVDLSSTGNSPQQHDDFNDDDDRSSTKIVLASGGDIDRSVKSAWSKSLDASLAARKLARRQKAQRTADNRAACNGSAAAIGVMIFQYFVDAHGYADATRVVIDSPMGLVGATQLACVFVLMIKIQSCFPKKE